MNRLNSAHHSAIIAFSRTNGRKSMVDLSGYCKSSRNAFDRAWRKQEFKFLQTVNDMILWERLKR